MAKAIRVTVTKVYQYIPDPTEDTYQSEGADTVEKMMVLDQRDYRASKFTLDEVVYTEPDEQALWEIVEDPS